MPADSVTNSSWSSRVYPDLLTLSNPETASHFVQFYADDAYLIENVALLAARALGRGDCAILIATPRHREALDHKFAARQMEFDRWRGSGRYVALDAAQTLAGFLVGGEPDPVKFERTVGALVDDVIGKSAHGFVFAFGEMVALLYADGRPQAAVRLEQTWNALARNRCFSLYCGYPLSSFERALDVNALLQICAEHSLAIPAETLF
jgi:superfamily I DNA/RNA helicase